MKYKNIEIYSRNETVIFENVRTAKQIIIPVTYENKYSSCTYRFYENVLYSRLSAAELVDYFERDYRQGMFFGCGSSIGFLVNNYLDI